MFSERGPAKSCEVNSNEWDRAAVLYRGIGVRPAVDVSVNWAFCFVTMILLANNPRVLLWC